MTWASKRKLYYGAIACIAVALFLLIKIYPSLSVEPTCVDRKQNGDERGVDCGGSCVRICQAEAAPLVVKWSRSFKVGDGFYNAFAYVENQNIQAASGIVRYEFTFYDSENVFIASREGATYVPASGRFGIFEPAVATGQRVPTTTAFRFTSAPDWVKVSADAAGQLIHAEAGVPSNLEVAPRLSVEVENPTIFSIRAIDVMAIVYDADNNALGTSKTVIDVLSAGASRELTFTWREPFAGEPKRAEIITQVNVFANR